MEELPAYIGITFGLTTLLTIGFFQRAARHSRATLILLLAWSTLQAGLGLSGFYAGPVTIPPRPLLLFLPPFLLIIGLFTTQAGRRYVDGLDQRALTLLHTVRVPVELVLFWLFIHNAVPEAMTFEGRNFDILSGLTAPLVYYFGLIRKQLGGKLVLLWNFICLVLLMQVVVTGILSAPLPFQMLSFDQPNVAILYFPFLWLPSVVVPMVLLSHLVSIRRSLRDGRKTAFATRIVAGAAHLN